MIIDTDRAPHHFVVANAYRDESLKELLFWDYVLANRFKVNQWLHSGMSSCSRNRSDAALRYLVLDNRTLHNVENRIENAMDPGESLEFHSASRPKTASESSECAKHTRMAVGVPFTGESQFALELAWSCERSLCTMKCKTRQ